jgi:Mce-associated membrane protein
MGANNNKNGKRTGTPAPTQNGQAGLSTTEFEGEREDDALALAEAEAAEAEARAAAAHARARAIRLRRQAEARATDAKSEARATDAKPDTESEDDITAAEEIAAESDTSTTAADAAAEDEAVTDASATEPANARRQWLRRPSLRRPSLRRPRLKTVVVAAAVVFIVACLTASGYMIWQHRNVVHERQQAAEFAAAARQGVVTLMSIDFNKAKEDVQRIIDNSTGDFKKDFQATADDFIKATQDAKAVTTTTVNATAVQSMTDHSAEVLVAATSKVSNSAGAKDEPRSWRLSVTMTRDGGQLKMSKVEFVP